MRSNPWVAATALILTLVTASVASSKVIILQLFEGDNGLNPLAGVTVDHGGNIFGTSENYGDSKNCVLGCGEVYETSPLGHGHWTTNKIYSFQDGDDGAHPQSPLTIDASGNLYGSSSAGTDTEVYRLAPQHGGSWSFSTLYYFSNDGNINTAAPLLLYNNSLFGLAYSGTATLVRLTEPEGGGLPWTLSTLFSFPSGVYPIWIASDPTLQNIYVSTREGNGTVVKLIPGQPWTEQVLYGFKGGVDGYYPNFVMAGADGAVYGTAEGGRHPKKLGFGGIVFKLSPPTKPGGAWTKTTLYNIRGWPPISLTAASNGALISVVFGEEDGGIGYVFQLTPPQGSGKNSWTFQKIGSFKHSGSCNPLNVQYGKDHALYGVLSGACDAVGALFEIK